MHTQPMTDWTQQLLEVSRKLVYTLDRRQVPRSLFEGTISREHLIEWGIQTYFYVQETQPNLLKSCRRMKRRGRQHAVIANLLLHKAAEEHEHHLWMLSDLSALGCSKAEVERTRPCAAVRAYIATNRYHAEEGSPYAILGTAFVLEYLSEHRASRAAKNLIAHSQIDGISHAVSFIGQHGELDGGHVDEALQLLRAITCPKAQEAILSMAKVTASLIPGFFPKPARRARRKNS
jgi:pyrroloquinoline quinone (PQQ) biosynthesis protein C